MSVNKATDGTLAVGEIYNAAVAFTIGAEAANAITVSMVFKNGAGQTQQVPKAGLWYLADNATGLTPSTSPPQTSIVAGSNGKMTKWTTNLSGFFVTTAAGLLDAVITDTGTPTFYLVIVLPNGSLAVSGAITFA